MCSNTTRRRQIRLFILASCMPNRSKFHFVFSFSALIRLTKDAFVWHLSQTVNNLVKENKLSLLSPLRKRRSPNSSSLSETLDYLVYLLLTNLVALRCTSAKIYNELWMMSGRSIMNKTNNTGPKTEPWYTTH